jgi:hypothetical protein
MFERIPWGQRLINIITDDRKTRSVHELNVFVSRPDASGGIDSLDTVARMIHDDSLRNYSKTRFS